MARNSMRIGFELTNFKETVKLLDGIESAVKARVMGVAMARAARPIINAAKAKAPVRSGALKRSITVAIREYPKDGKVVALIGPDKDYYAGGKKLKKGADRRGADRPANYAHLVEFGHYSAISSERFGGFTKGFKRRKSSGARLAQTERSFILPKPFLRPAVATATPLAVEQLSSGLEKGISREIDRMKRLQKKARRL